MIRPFRNALAILGVLCFACYAASAANPNVVFIGDYMTSNWPAPTGSNWTNLGVSTPDSYTSDGNSGYWAQNISQAINLHPGIIHIMLGAEDAALADDGTVPYVNSVFVSNIEI